MEKLKVVKNMFSHLVTISTCDRRTNQRRDRRTEWHLATVYAMHTRRAINIWTERRI